ncbi:GerW family sporulation protein [Lentibacillus saliphilus]|uniref:GerW family sporulation protein n=1 Tax=Lentibacillus saliphilus TaxID=2737028 RepID=UPI001C2FEEB3|nr:GerW family sporulation protein [Lentibacillus saliphilus]
MDTHPIQGLMTTAMENLKDMIEVNTIIGDPVKSPDGSIIIPVSKVGFGFAAGGSEFQPTTTSQSSQELPFGGGSGGGVSITPIAFLIVKEKDVKMIHLDQQTHIYEKLLDLAPQAAVKIEQMINQSLGAEKTKNKEANKEGCHEKDKNKDEEHYHYDI